MVKRIAPIRVISFFLLTACGALCQSGRSSADLHQGEGSNSPEVQRQEMPTWKSLPDAPSAAQRPAQADKCQTFANEARSPLTPGGVGINAGVMREREPGHVTPGPQSGLTATYKAVFIQKDSAPFSISICIRRCSSGTRVIILRPAVALWAGPLTQLRAFLSRVTRPERGV